MTKLSNRVVRVYDTFGLVEGDIADHIQILGHRDNYISVTFRHYVPFLYIREDTP